jgi:hypothetical protein
MIFLKEKGISKGKWPRPLSYLVAASRMREGEYKRMEKGRFKVPSIARNAARTASRKKHKLGSQGGLATVLEAAWTPVRAIGRVADVSTDDDHDEEYEFDEKPAPTSGRFRRSTLFGSTLGAFLTLEASWRCIKVPGGDGYNVVVVFILKRKKWEARCQLILLRRGLKIVS